MSDSLSRLVEAVRSAGVDIAPGYCEYVRLAFAIANDCGEAGREGFIALCSLSVKFNREKAERLFSNALKKGDHRIHLGTAFHLAELAGVRLEPPSRPRDTHANNASNASNAAPFSHTRARDNNVEIEIEESGKGVLAWTRMLVQPIHDEIRATVAEEMKRYKKEMTSFNSLGREKAKAEEPEMPLNRMFIFSGNNTGTGILQNIIDSGGVGIICETEADMVSNSIASDYGHWSEVIRSSFDHDPLSYNRRTDREYRELRHSHLSVLISGTPGQVKPLIPSSENGLFSRQMFYYMPRVLHWINQFSLQRTDTSLEFQKLGKDWIAHLREIQKLGVISLRLTDAQIVSFNEVFQTLFERSRKGTGNEMNSSVVRMAINIGRILSIVALLRITGECEEAGDFAASLRKSPRLTPDPQTCSDNIKDGIITRWDLSIQEDDFQAVLSLAEPMYLHAVHILSFLPANEVKNRGMADQERLFITLDTGFTYQSLLEEAEKLKIPKNTACSCLQRWQKQGIVRKGEKRGDYKKT